MYKKKMTPMEMDAIGEILNISLGSSATAASTMLNARVDITTPGVQVKNKDEFEFSNLEPAVGVEITYVEGLTGSNVMLLKRTDVKTIVEMMMGMEMSDEEFELNEMNISAICEVMNQMMGASSTALAELLSRTVNISTPISFEIKTTQQFIDKYFIEDDPMVVIHFNLKIADRMESEFINVMPIALAKELVAGFFPEGTLDQEEEEETAAPEEAISETGSDAVLDQAAIESLIASANEESSTPETAASEPASDAVLDQAAIESLIAETAPAETPAAPVETQPAAPPPVAPAPAPAAPAPQVQQTMPASADANAMVMQQMLEMMRQQMEIQQQELQQIKNMQKSAAAPKQIKVNPVPQPNLTAEGEEGDPDANLDLIMGVPLEVSVEIGRTKKLVRDILELNKGSLVVLNKLAGEQVDVFVNGQCIAKGDVVVVEDNFGVRITEILQEEIVVEQ